MTVKFISDVIMALKSHPIEIPVNVTVFGSPTHNPYLVLHYGEGGTLMNKSINITNGTQILQIPTTNRLNCTSSVIQATVTTADPLVELQENNIISIHIGKKIYQFPFSLILLEISVPTIGFEMTAYSVMEGDTVTVCASVLCGSLLQDEAMISLITNDTATGHCMKILHAVYGI